jgi:hypothetical protein
MLTRALIASRAVSRIERHHCPALAQTRDYAEQIFADALLQWERVLARELQSERQARIRAEQRYDELAAEAQRLTQQ